MGTLLKFRSIDALVAEIRKRSRIVLKNQVGKEVKKGDQVVLQVTEALALDVVKP